FRRQVPRGRGERPSRSHARDHDHGPRFGYGRVGHVRLPAAPHRAAKRAPGLRALSRGVRPGGRRVAYPPPRPDPPPRRPWLIRRALTAAEGGRTLLLEGAQALAKVLAAGGELDGEGLVVEVLIQRGDGAGMEQPLGEAQGDGRARGQPGDDLIDDGIELTGWRAAVHHAPRRRLGALD